MRFIARCEGMLRHGTERELWLWRAVAEAPEQREAPLELAEMFHERAAKSHLAQDWLRTARAAEICVSRRNRVMSYLTRAEAWGAWPHELLAIALWYGGDRAGAARAHVEAKAINPEDPMVKANDRWFSAPVQ